jgi:hypothetical protein
MALWTFASAIEKNKCSGMGIMFENIYRKSSMRHCMPLSNSKIFTAKKLFVFILFMLSLLGIAGGCDQSTRPQLGTVHGKVTLDGKPLVGVGVAFRSDSEKAARESTAVTDDTGKYALNYIRDIPGAAVGTHRVRIVFSGKISRAIQEKYNTKSILRKEVVAGDNEINFDLTSK